MNKLVYVNPMSEYSSEIYDKNLISNIKTMEIYYFCSNYIKNTELENINYIKNYNYKNKNILMKGISYTLSQLKLLLFIIKNKIKIVHIQWLRLYFIDYFLILILRKLNVKVILTAHNVLPHDTGLKYRAIYKKIYNLLSGIIIHEENGKEELVEIFKINKNKIKVIPHGLIDGIINLDEPASNIIKKKKINFCLFGVLKEYKGVDILLEAWNDTELQNNSDIQLIIAGKKEMEIKYKNKNNLKIIDRTLSDTEVKELLEKIDVFILPYRKISQSGVLLSILKKHKVIIVSKVGGLTEVFKFGKVGYILEENNYLELRKIIKTIIMNKDELKKIKDNKELWQKIEKYYSWEIIGEKTENFYKEILLNNVII